ncbi:DUF6274 family protein [Streptomyces wuyuanensis]|uniref:DUF6274 family protein n=1 Tax=Streptomyces wuyuanensis TaxID=1196353 RepID=UPI00367F3799
MAASTARHETRALLRAHLAAVSGFRHLTRQCPVCHRLLRLAMDPSEAVPEESVPAPPAPLGGRQAPAPVPAVGTPESREPAAEPAEAADADHRTGSGDEGPARP